MNLITLSHALQLWVIPEIEKRIQEGQIDPASLPIEVKCFRFLQWKFPDGRVENAIELNEEFQPFIRVSLKEQNKFKVGDRSSLSDLDSDEGEVLAPERNGTKPSYFFSVRLFNSFVCLWNFTRNYPEGLEAEDLAREPSFPVKDVFTELLNLKKLDPADKLETICGHDWPPGPGLHPRVFVKVHQNPGIVDSDDFVGVIAETHNGDYWRSQITSWSEYNLFPERIGYVKRAIDAHLSGDYVSSIYILMPQFEGVIRGFVQMCGEKPRKEFDHMLGQLERLVMSRRVLLFPRAMLVKTLSFLKDSTFWKFTRQPKSQVNRHGVLHGIFHGFECEELSMKLLILFDALAYLILHDAVASGRALSDKLGGRIMAGTNTHKDG